MFANTGKQVMKLISNIQKVHILSFLATCCYLPVSMGNYSLKPVIKERLHYHFIQQCFTDIENSSRGEFYSIFKFEFGFEKYLSKLSVKNRINLSKFRSSNMKFPIETGRWQNIARNDRSL
jgi:hypothetical protein